MSPGGGKEVETDRSRKESVLLIGFDTSEMELLSQGLHSHGYDSIRASDPIGALEHVYGMGRTPPDVLLINLNPVHRSGLKLIKIVRAFRQGFPIIAITPLGADSRIMDIEESSIPTMHGPIDFVQLNKNIQALRAVAKAVVKGRAS